MGTVVEVAISGLATGAVYALVALSLNMVYVTARVVSFAQGDIGMLVVAGTLELGATQGNLPLGVRLVLCFAGAALVALLVDIVAVRAIRSTRGVTSYGWIVSTLGASIVLQNWAATWFGTESQTFPEILPTGTLNVFGGVVPLEQVLTVVLAAVLVAILAVTVRRTQWGRMARALADNREIAASCGVPVNTVRSSVIMVSAVLVGVAATVQAPQTFVNVYMGTPLLLNGMVAVVLGGLGEVGGGLAGGLVLGLANAIAGRWLDSTLVPYVPFLLLLVWLIFGIEIRAATRRVVNEVLRRPTPTGAA